ncbi:spermine synthase isoform X2 [Cylas formicarius]|uniref:spermine synthase isoform X2 n=1 Tax=Cylas formicarius TaxID=197179 RepID=UPI002958C5F5|nr:spermine synthase isoform X2 [Cylas formicarius]
MAVNTILLDFSVDPNVVKNNSSVLSTNIENVLRDFLSGLKTVSCFSLDGSSVKIYTAEPGILLNLRIYTSGLVTVNIDYFKGDKQEAILSFELSKVFEQKLSIALDSFRSKMFPPVKRGAAIDVYLSSSDERLLEYDIDSLVFEEATPFQKVQIVHSKSLGNMLVLDDLQNIAESDLIYTETLMQRGKENYRDAEIVILGGGDGALLYELLKEKPKEVVMLEIDEVVMRACAKYMRSICGNVLDKYSGPNYKIIVGDCMKSLEQYIKEDRKFDYVFGDLTDVPISDSLSGELWTFINKVLQMSFKVLKPSGKFMTHLTGTSSPDCIEMYKSQLNKIQPPVTFTTSNAFVPSFLEDWVFCQVSFAKKAVE